MQKLEKKETWKEKITEITTKTNKLKKAIFEKQAEKATTQAKHKEEQWKERESETKQKTMNEGTKGRERSKQQIGKT